MSCKVTMISLVIFTASLLQPQVTRRSLFAASSFYLSKEESKDWYSHWSFFNLAPPPIEKEVNYDALLSMVEQNKIKTVQIAPQHDCLVATTTEGHRVSLLINDEDVELFLVDSMKDDKLPFEVLPIDSTKQVVRQMSIHTMLFYLSFVALDFAGQIPWDTTPYSSWEQRKNAPKNNISPKSLRERIISYFDELFK